MDQAEGLRMAMEQPRGIDGTFSAAGGKSGDLRRTPPRVISVSSGKGGVGKTNVVANLALAFTQMGQRVLIFDSDLSLANIDVLLGLTPKYTIEHLLKRQKTIFEILVQGPGGMWIIPASSGVLDFLDLDESQKLFLLNEMDLVAERIDILLIDTAAGISANVLYFNTAAAESIVIATPEPTSITDAYALIKVLVQKHRKKNFLILVNGGRSASEAKEVFTKLSRAADRFLGSLSLDYLGFIPYDEKLPMAVKKQKPVLEIYPQCASSRRFLEIARNLLDQSGRDPGSRGNVQFFWRQLFQVQQAPNDGGID
jgi:flagellar biosynthesis protein FlhG